jgi:cob(I)alamin adenosyltransferase
MVRINKIYTKSGDAGKTHVIGGERSKTDARLEVCGTIDELNAWIGSCRTTALQQKLPWLSTLLESVQQDLFNIGAEVATIEVERLTKNKKISQTQIEELERQIDQCCQDLPELTSFVLPGGTELNSQLHITRTVCRRAERDFWKLATKQDELIPEHVGIYLNRLSDLLFALARKAAFDAGSPEFLWKNS